MTFDLQLTQWLRDTVSALFPDCPVPADRMAVVRTTEEGFGDYQTNAALALSKPLKTSPRAVAEKIAAAAKPAFLRDIQVAGPGFINFYLSTEGIVSTLLGQEQDARLGTPDIGAGQTVVIDYSSPNVAKPMHIGHIRSTVIGNALDRLHRFAGYRVLADNHLGDWGTQFGKLIMGYRHFLDAEAFAADPISELERLYVASHNRSETDEAWLDSCRQELVKLQQGDAQNLELWRTFIDASLKEFDRIYYRLGVSFDLVRGESFYNPLLPGVLDALTAAGLLKESEGAKIVDLEEEKLGVCIVQKKDGGFNYAATDLATVRSRVEEFQPAKIIYVTDERQQLHFRQFFSVSRKLGCAAELVHVWFGLMRLPEGTFSTRQGNVIKLELMLDEAESRALAMVSESSPTMPVEQQVEVARAVGLGAVKYADLSQNPQSLVTFTWDKALALNGNSAPYLQYAHARIRSVLDKFAAEFPGVNLSDWPVRLELDIERKLALRLAQFGEVIVAAVRNYRPNYLADYLYELSQIYSNFYQNVPFMKAEPGVRESRLRLCSAVARVLAKGLELLGIEAPERI